MRIPLAFAVLSTFTRSALGARQWNDTGVGTIIFEEAWTIPELLFQVVSNVPPVGQTNADLQANLIDVHNQRLAHMDATGVDFMVLSCASPCIQGIQDAANASAMATTVNNALADIISNNTVRFGGFASLSMHDPAAAAQELNRTVTELGFFGALINDYQVAGTEDNITFIFYDQPEFDVFWQMVVALDVPVYFHPRSNPDPVGSLLYDHAPFLKGPSQEFAVTLSTHILGLCVNGVFEYVFWQALCVYDHTDSSLPCVLSRFPNLTILVGHLGERVPSDLWRINDQLLRQVPEGMPMQKNVTFYLENNVVETTSGNFATDLLMFHSQQIGLDRIVYSVDYPFVAMEQGEAWLKNELPAVLNETELLALKRGRAIELLKLNQ
ncbi:hypothetical protein OF83DRAFT_1154866 [Amylostereum chailletii]|nr:hypothetical protein OF83DRAFT_1154866 [Amylostereum chailletii]